MRIVYCLITAAIGILIMKFARPIFLFFGEEPDVERFFHSFGGTQFFIQLLGAVTVIISLLFLFRVIG